MSIIHYFFDFCYNIAHMKKIIALIILVALALLIYSLSHKNSREQGNETVLGTQLETITFGNYIVDINESTIEWKANMGTIKNHHGNINISSGNLEIDNNGTSTGMIVVDMNTITSDAGDMLNNHLKSADFFDVENNPESQLAVTSIEDSVLKGDLTLKGITHPIESKMVITEQENNKITVTGTLEIDRSLWDVRFGSARFFHDLGDQVINDIITIHYNIVLLKQ